MYDYISHLIDLARIIQKNNLRVFRKTFDIGNWLFMSAYIVVIVLILSGFEKYCSASEVIKKKEELENDFMLNSRKNIFSPIIL